jgi:hypothetical protein
MTTEIGLNTTLRLLRTVPPKPVGPQPPMQPRVEAPMERVSVTIGYREFTLLDSSARGVVPDYASLDKSGRFRKIFEKSQLKERLERKTDS